MKLAELYSLVEQRMSELSVLQTELLSATGNDSGSEPDRTRVASLLRRTMALWAEVDEMMAYDLSVKSKINIPELGMSIAEAELLADGYSRRETYMAMIMDGLTANLRHRPEEVPESDEVVPTCPHCGEVRGIPISLDQAEMLLTAITRRHISLRSAIERAGWSVETTWYDVDEDGQEINSRTVTDGATDPIEALGIGVLPGDILRPPTVEPQATPPTPPQAVGTDFEVIAGNCPFCMSPGRNQIERHWITQGQDIMSLMAYADSNSMIPVNTNPTVARIHFDDHFKRSDHIR